MTLLLILYQVLPDKAYIVAQALGKDIAKWYYFTVELSPAQTDFLATSTYSPDPKHGTTTVPSLGGGIENQGCPK